MGIAFSAELLCNQQMICSLTNDRCGFYFEVTEERGNSVKRAFGRKYFLVTPWPTDGGREITLDIKTKRLIDETLDLVHVNKTEIQEFVKQNMNSFLFDDKSLEIIIKFCRNPLKYEKLKSADPDSLASKFVFSFTNDFKIIVLPNYLPAQAKKNGTIRVYGSE
jgi:hypothetical protein